jgi:hypothetical protein
VLQSDQGFDATRCTFAEAYATRCTFAEAGSSQEAKRWADSTLRSRACRARKRMGLVGVRSVRPTKKQITKLIEGRALTASRYDCELAVDYTFKRAPPLVCTA